MQNAERRIENRKRRRHFFVLHSAFCILHSLFFFLLAAPLHAAQQRPTLIVIISIDQFRYEYLERFSPWFSAGGFNRFLKSGANFRSAYYLHANTFTGPGHASIGTGRTPAENGIVANTWFDRTTGAPRYCVQDDRAAGGMSPVTLAEDSLGDRLKEKYPQSRVIAVSIKDRAAILMGGRKADAAYWFEGNGFVSSSYYRADATLFAFNKGVAQYIPASGKWTLSGIIPNDALQKVTFDPPAAWPFKNPRYGTHFDHPIPNLGAMMYTPFANDMLLDFASRVIDVESLGARGTPDLLFVGLSTPDYIGHSYGPDSMEVADDAVRLDRSLENFLNGLDAKFHGRLLVALTSDHGVQSTPEIAKLRDPKIDAGRIDFHTATSRIPIERALARRLNVAFDAAQPFVAFFEEPALYINWKRVAELKLDGERVKRALRDVMAAMPGVRAVFTNSELLAVNPNPSELESAVRASFRADRSGDVLIELKKNWIWSVGNANTTHGQPLPDDQHVPLLFWGTGVAAGRYDDRVAPTDIARTVSALLGFRAGGEQSIVLPCADPRAVVLAIALAEIPAGDARIDQLEVNGDTATVRLWVGGVEKPQPGVASLSCGTGYMFTLRRENGVWRIVNRGLAMC